VPGLWFFEDAFCDRKGSNRRRRWLILEFQCGVIKGGNAVVVVSKRWSVELTAT
jgi:hypothetical protein